MVLEDLIRLSLKGGRASQSAGAAAVFGTFSIVGRSPDGLLGVASSSRALAVGARVTHVRSRVAAVASQAYANPYLALDTVSQADATPLDALLAALVERDPGRDWRQIIAIGPRGGAFAFTGPRTEPWAGHRVGVDCAAAGNILVDGRTVDEMVATFERRSDLELSARLLEALKAGQAAGGDRRGRQSAALLVAASEELPYIDLRVDDHPDPVHEISRLFDLLGPAGLARARREATSREPRGAAELAEQQRRLREEEVTT